MLGTSLDAFLETRKGCLRTEDCFRFFFALLDSLCKGNRKPVFVGYVTSFDVNHILRDLDDETLAKIIEPDEKEFVKWRDWEILYFPKKLLRIRHQGRDFTWYDVFSFFGSSFEKAIRGFLPHDDRFKIITEGKAARASFTRSDWVKIKRYNKLECELLVSLMDTFRGMLESNGIQLRKWHGPGAVADFLLGKRGFNVHTDFPVYADDDTPLGLSHAWDCAFFGGRIENLIVGTVNNVWSYDINSAYPKAASLLYRLTFARRWRYSAKPRDVESFGPVAVFFVEWSLPRSCKIGPFPWRDKRGRIYFPLNGMGWYWAPEVKAARRIFGKRIKLRDVWYQPAGESSKLASIVPFIYAERQRQKSAGDPSEYALKISLNSLYGKLAQRVGKAPYLCLPYAGLITSYTRSQLLSAAYLKPDAILGFATDAIFTRESLPLSLSDKLGDWKEERYKTFMVLMNGFYRLDDGARKVKIATRGVPSSPDWEAVIKELNETGKVTFPETKFVTHSMAINFPKAYGPDRLKFVKREKVINPFASVKRAFQETDIQDWSKDFASSVPVSVDHLPSYPSSLTTEATFKQEAKQERIESEGSLEEEND